MINGAHIIIYSKDAEADRAFLKDVLGFRSVDVGHGWLIFALPPSEVACHPGDENDRHELYLMCEDLKRRWRPSMQRAFSARMSRNRRGAYSPASSYPVAGNLGCISRNIRGRRFPKNLAANKWRARWQIPKQMLRPALS